MRNTPQAGFWRSMPSYLLIALFFSSSLLCAQGLENIPVIQPGNTYKDGSLSFILNTMDFHKFKNLGPQRYDNSVQIIDADKPFPPRWFTTVSNVYSTDQAYMEDSINHIIKQYYTFDAAQQGDYITFFERAVALYMDVPKAEGHDGYYVCNKKMEAVDSVSSDYNKMLFYHGFAINARKEKLVLLKVETTLDMHELTGQDKDKAMPAIIDVIEVLDSTGKTIFRWDPVPQLGVNSVAYKDVTRKTFSSEDGKIDWSHATGAIWDYDGNILYCFRHIGVGKISSADGHVIWRIDCKNLPEVAGKDTLTFYEPHDLQNISHTDTTSTYSVFSMSNAEPGNTFPTYAIEFTVKNKTGEFVKSRKVYPEHTIFNGGSGNYDKEPNGNYLLHYGQYPKEDLGDTSHVFMEYRNKKDSVILRLKMPAVVNAYKVHQLNGWRPPRPIVAKEGNVLKATGDMSEWTWYKLPDNPKTQTVKVGHGASYTPTATGQYCVVGKYGMGYSASLPVEFTRQ